MSLSLTSIIEFVGTFIYVLISFLTQSPFIVSVTIGLLFLISGKIYNKGDFNPILTITKYILDYYKVNEFLYKILFQVLGGLLSILIYKMLLYNKYV